MDKPMVIVLPHNTMALKIQPPKGHPPICTAELQLSDYCAPAPTGCWQTIEGPCGRCERVWVPAEPRTPQVVYPLGNDEILSDLDGMLCFQLNSKINLLSDKMSGIILIRYNNGIDIEVPIVVEKRRVNTRIDRYTTVLGGCNQC